MLTIMRKSTAFVVVCCLFFIMLDCALGLPFTDAEKQESIIGKNLVQLKANGQSSFNEYSNLVDRVSENINLRHEVIDYLINKLSIKLNQGLGNISNELSILLDLDASESLELIKGWWDRPARISGLRVNCDSQIKMLTCISKWLSNNSRIEFLSDIMYDEYELNKIRLESILLLIRNGSNEAIDRVLYSYGMDVKDLDYSEKPGAQLSDYDIEDTSYKTDGDTDGDGFSDYLEKGILLDPLNLDTDGDLIIDTADRNPLLNIKSKRRNIGSVDDSKKMLFKFIAYLFAKFENEGYRFHHNFIVIPQYNLSNDPEISGGINLLWNIDIDGINGFFLHMNEEQVIKHRSMFGNHVTELSLSFVKKLNDSTEVYHIDTVTGNSDISFEITVRKVEEYWLPVSWKFRNV